MIIQILLFLFGLSLVVYSAPRAVMFGVLAITKDPESARFLREESRRELEAGNNEMAFLRQVQADNDEGDGTELRAIVYTAVFLIGASLAVFALRPGFHS